MLTPSTEQQLLREVAQLKARLEKVEPALAPPPEPKRTHKLIVYNSANDPFTNSNRVELHLDCPVFATLIVNGPLGCNPDAKMVWTAEDPVPVAVGEARAIGGHTFTHVRNPAYDYTTIKCSCGLLLRASKIGVTLEYELQEPPKQKQKKPK